MCDFVPLRAARKEDPPIDLLCAQAYRSHNNVTVEAYCVNEYSQQTKNLNIQQKSTLASLHGYDVIWGKMVNWIKCVILSCFQLTK